MTARWVESALWVRMGALNKFLRLKTYDREFFMMHFKRVRNGDDEGENVEKTPR